MSKEKKQITLGLIIAWIVGTVFLLSGGVYLVSSPVAGIVLILASAITIPATMEFIRDKTGVDLSGAVRFVAVVLLLGIATYLGQGSVETEPATPQTVGNTEEEQDKKEEKEQEVQTYSIGDEVVVEDRVRWVIQDAENLGQRIESGNSFTEPETTSGKFIKVKGEIENITNKEISIGEVPKIKDSQGREFEQSSSLFSAIETEGLDWSSEFKPSITKDFTAVYEVAEDSEGLRFQASNLGFFNVETKDVYLEM